MGSRGIYRGIYSSLFDDPDYQRLSPPAKLVLLTARQCSQAGPAAIFRYYPTTLAQQTGYALKVVRSALEELAHANWIRYDDAVLWVRNGLRHDPAMRLADPKHHLAVARAIEALPHREVVLTFCDYYGIARPFDAPSCATLAHPPSEDCSTPSTKQKTEDQGPPKGLASETAAPATPWVLSDHIRTALEKTRFQPLVGDQQWWQAQFRAHNGINMPKELLEAEAWCTSRPDRAPRKDYRRFLNSWFGRAKEMQA